MPTKTAPLQGMVDSFAAAASTPSRFSSPPGHRSFSDPPMRNALSSGIAEIGHRHVHGHGAVAMPQTATVPGDATVHKTEVVETVVETQKNQAAVAKQDTAQSAASSSQSAASSISGLGGAGVASVETAAAASQTAAAASSATAAKEEKVVKKTKKTTTTVVKKGNDATGLGGVTAGNVQEVHQVVEETVHQGSATSVAAASESAAVSSQSSAGSTAVGGNSVGGSSADAVVSSAAASNAASSASATETNATTSVKKKVTKTTTITKTKASDIGGLAGMNSELPTAVLSNLNTKQAATKKPPTAILSENNDKKQAIKPKAVLIATDKPKLAAPVITEKPVVVAETTTAKQQVSTEEVEIEAEEMVVTSTTKPNTATGNSRRC